MRNRQLVWLTAVKEAAIAGIHRQVAVNAAGTRAGSLAYDCGSAEDRWRHGDL